jgi:hypothetical protein
MERQQLMKSLKEYLAEAELLESVPSIGDVFEIEIAREEIVIETTVVGYTEDGVILEADDTMMKILTHVGYLTEDSNMPTARDSISPIHSNANRDRSDDDDLEEANDPDFKWGQDTFTDKWVGVNKYDPKTNSYKSTGPVTPNDPETSITVVQTHNKLDKNGKTVRDDFATHGFARNPETGTGSYSVSRQDKDYNYTQDYQQNVSKPWMDYSINKAKYDANKMLPTPNDAEYQSAPQGPMSQFRATTNEAEYQGRTVPLGKPMKGDVKKSKVYVKNAKGNVVKVNFGDPNMKIKKSNPKRRKSFRARHNCANPGPRTSARYWSCRAW